MSHSDERFMRIALELAKRGMGNTAPNPNVGCIIVKDGIIVGRGWTAPKGRPHAETIALGRAGEKAKGATAYVTLEPCCHHGKTPPCTDAIIKTGITRVVIATGDPHIDVAGGGIKALNDAGIEVTEGVLKEDAEKITAGFLKAVKEKRPYVTLKLATTSDDKITMPKGAEHWFTGDEAKSFAHMLRYRNDAILVGVETILADNPSLDCRLPGLEKFSPERIILDNKNRTPKEAKVRPCLIMNGKDLQKTLEELASKGITRLLVEGGGKIAESFLKENLVDNVVWIEAPDIKGDSNAPDISLMLKNYTDKMTLTDSGKLGKDKFSIYES